MLHIILAETALELIPKDHQQHSSVIQGIKRYRNAAKILDSSLHHSMMQELEHSEKRGRPDILHHFLLDGLGSIANFKDKIRLHFHCPSGVYSVDPKLRCPRDTSRFRGLMYQLLKLGHVPKNPPYFIEQSPFELKEFIENNIKPVYLCKLSQKGEFRSFDHIVQEIIEKETESDENIVVLIGGFQKGAFSSKITDLCGPLYSIGNKGYDSWIVINRLIVLYEYFNHLLS